VGGWVRWNPVFETEQLCRVRQFGRLPSAPSTTWNPPGSLARTSNGRTVSSSVCALHFWLGTCRHSAVAPGQRECHSSSCPTPDCPTKSRCARRGPLANAYSTYLWDGPAMKSSCGQADTFSASDWRNANQFAWCSPSLQGSLLQTPPYVNQLPCCAALAADARSRIALSFVIQLWRSRQNC